MKYLVFGGEYRNIRRLRREREEEYEESEGGGI